MFCLKKSCIKNTESVWKVTRLSIKLNGWITRNIVHTNCGLTARNCMFYNKNMKSHQFISYFNALHVFAFKNISKIAPFDMYISKQLFPIIKLIYTNISFQCFSGYQRRKHLKWRKKEYSLTRHIGLKRRKILQELQWNTPTSVLCSIIWARTNYSQKSQKVSTK